MSVNSAPRRYFCLVVIGFIVLMTLLPLAVAANQVILEKPVKITVADINGLESDDTHYHLEISIVHGADRYNFDTLVSLQNSNLKKAIEYQRTRIHWKGPYLMVGWERGGGNASWGCLDTIFTLRKGKLLNLGETDADTFENGIFKDWYDKFEGNELTSHAKAPLIRLVLSANTVNTRKKRQLLLKLQEVN